MVGERETKTIRQTSADSTRMEIYAAHTCIKGDME